MPRRVQSKLKWFETGKIDALVKLLAKGLAKRQIGHLLKLDRNDIKLIFDFGVKVSYTYALKVTDDVLKHKLTFLKLKTKYGRRGLQAVNDWHNISEAKRLENLGKDVLRLRGDPANPKTSNRDIAKQLGVSITTVTETLSEVTGLRYQPNYKFQTGAKKREKMISLNMQGLPIPQIATLLECSEVHVRQTLRNLNIPFVHKFPQYTEKDWYVIHALVQRGVPWLTIAQIYARPVKGVAQFYRNKFPVYAHKIEKKAVATSGKI